MICFTLDYHGKCIDLQLDECQEIKNCLKVLADTGRINISSDWDCCKSVLQNRVVSIYKTFQEEKIYTGDILLFR